MNEATTYICTCELLSVTHVRYVELVELYLSGEFRVSENF
jgi:hypothetical protein